MEQMCTGIYYFLGPLFVIAEWESFPCLPIPYSKPLILLLLNGPVGTLGPVQTWVWRVVWKGGVSVQSLGSLALAT